MIGKTRIFLDSGSAQHTRDTLAKLPLDGQTTNPTYFVKSNPEVLARIERGEKYSREELLVSYKKLASELSELLPEDGSISIEVYADKNSTAKDLLAQARVMREWIPQGYIKLPIIPAGLEAARILVDEGTRVNMTLCFSQAQAAAVHTATRGAEPNQVFVSPFISRLDKVGVNGFTLLENIQKMYMAEDSHVSILAASIHSVYDIAHVIEAEIDIITIPYDDFAPWVEAGTPGTTENVHEKNVSKLETIKYEVFDLAEDWEHFDIKHELTDVGLEKFAADWNAVIENSGTIE